MQLNVLGVARLGLLALIGCGGAGGLTHDNDMTPDIQIANPSCMIIGPDSADIMVEGLTTANEGNTVDGQFALAGPPVTNVTGFFNCGSWNELFDGMQESVGCIRQPGAPISMQAINITHDITVSGTIADPSTLDITLRVRDGQSGPVLASDTMTVTCSSIGAR